MRLGPTLHGPLPLLGTGVRCLRLVTGVDDRGLVGTHRFEMLTHLQNLISLLKFYQPFSQDIKLSFVKTHSFYKNLNHIYKMSFDKSVQDFLNQHLNYSNHFPEL